MASFLDISANPFIWYLLIAAIVGVFGFLLHLIWQRYRSQVHLVQQNMLVSALADVMEAAVVVDTGGKVEFINPAAERVLKYKLRSARGKHFSTLFSLFDPQTRVPLQWLEKAKANDRPLVHHGLLNTAGIGELPIHYTVQVLHYAEIAEPFYMLLVRDQTEINALQVRLDYMEMHDPQTQLLNRKSFEWRLKVAIDQVRQHGVKHSFCLIAMDQFKLVIDAVGHGAGDALIERISRLLKEQIDNKRDVLARLGGDEFGILLQEVEPAAAIATVERIRQALEKYEFNWNKVRQHISASIAFVPLYKGLVTPNRILSVADAACRIAKSKGGNRIHIYRPNDQEIIKQRDNMMWLGRLKKAFDAGNFYLVAQPIQPLHPNAFSQPFHHYEILIRLFDENRQPIPPDEFIPAAEYYSMMPLLDRWVVRNLLRFLKTVTQRQPCPVFAVNLSGQSLDEPDFLQFVLDNIRQAGIPPAMLCFEITERVAIHNLDLAQHFIQTLKSLGCSFSLDDFGTGVSSFSYLKSLPVDYLKIDGSFIKDIISDEVAQAMVRSVNQVGHMMGVQVIAEYVENAQVIKLLRDIGVDYGQGYGISRPIPLDEVIAKHTV